jgi:N-acetylmuramoyl-L-alanine amidase
MKKFLEVSIIISQTFSVLFILFCTSASWATQDTSGLNWYGATRNPKSIDDSAPIHVLIDPGHGGRDEGAKGALGTIEKELSYRVSHELLFDLLRLSKTLRKKLDVRMTRNRDTFLSLSERVEMANIWPAHYFISIHFNSSTYRNAKGYEIYFLSNEASNEEVKNLVSIENNSRKPIKSEVLNMISEIKNNKHIEISALFAEKVYNVLFENFPHKSKRGISQGPFTVLVGTEMPAILIEVGYITNPEEAQKFLTTDYLKKFSSAISTAVMDFILNKKNLI